MPTIPTRKIGNDDVAEIGLGLMGLSAYYGQVESDEERFQVSVGLQLTAVHHAYASIVVLRRCT
jgi:hypothetical protein